MKVTKPTRHTTLLLVILALVLVGGGIILATRSAEAPSSSSTPTSSSVPSSTTPAVVDGEPIRIRGESLCLPHKDTNGPQTMECAIGIKAEDGTYYALTDSTGDYSLTMKAGSGKQIEVTGTFVGRDDSKYQDIGIITMTAVDVL